ncbi:Thiol-disulfide isomerase or thioredoxin [Micromonospora pattaloongensis]|uniref:Thiol-disulfide isomerase or thioredoxin n=2 Tax=Micromonospora pattaloongensis TaxID=405436 RepID=A0A1H3PZG3_9ACTN|nr:Thiol-disulfide isomerase or thioredoxin [Micromonospora pattaloongensis]
MTGLLVAALVLAGATAFGLWRRSRAGRLRAVATVTPHRRAATMPDAATTPDVHRATPDPAAAAPDGTTADPAPAADAHGRTPGRAATDTVPPELLAGLGVEAGVPVTLLQFSSAFCAPCRATRRVLTEVTGVLDGVRHVEVDAESHLDAVRALKVWRTPTVLVVDGEGRIVQRASGVPAKAQVIAALAPLLAPARP